jgi:hypothetical protein
MSITQITAGLIADGAVTANTLNSTQTFTVNNLTVTNTASVVTLIFADNTVQTTAYTGTNAQAYDQSLNTYNDVVFHNITSTGTISSENFYVGGPEGSSNLYNSAGEFLISNGGHNMMTMNFGAQSYNSQEVGAVTFNSGRFDIGNEATGPMIEALPDKTTFYTPIIATTATFNSADISTSITFGPNTLGYSTFFHRAKLEVASGGGVVGNVSITVPNAASTITNALVITNGSEYYPQFDYFDGITLTNSGPSDLILGSGNEYITASKDGNIYFGTANTDGKTNYHHQWKLSNTGTMYFPDNTAQITAWAGLVNAGAQTLGGNLNANGYTINNVPTITGGGEYNSIQIMTSSSGVNSLFMNDLIAGIGSQLSVLVLEPSQAYISNHYQFELHLGSTGSNRWTFHTDAMTFPDGSIQTTAYTGTNAQAYDQSLNTYNDVIFHNITSTGTISSEQFYVGGTEGGSTLYNNNGEFLINNLGHIMMTMNFGAQLYNSQEVGAVTFNSGRFDISNEVTGGMIEALPDKTTFYTPIIATTATFNDTVNIVNTLTIGNYSIAPVDGVAGQALVTDGMGQVSFQNIVPSLDFGSFIAPAGFTLDMGRFI